MTIRSIVPDKCGTIVHVWKDGVDNQLISVENRLTVVEDDIGTLGAFQFDSDLSLIRSDIRTANDKNDEQDGILVNIITAISEKVNIDYVDSKLALKVDKINGKGLSTEDYTTGEKEKLLGVEADANNYVHPEKHPANMITEDSTRRFITDTERINWNGIPTDGVVSGKADKTYVDTELGKKVNNTGNEDIAGEKNFLNYVHIGKGRSGNRSIQFYNESIGSTYEDITGGMTGVLGGIAAMPYVGGISHVLDFHVNLSSSHMRVLIGRPSITNSRVNAEWRLYVNSEGEGWITQPMRASPGSWDAVNTKYVLDRVDEIVGFIEGESNDMVAYVDDRVKTPVPANAKFTDTVVDISGKADRTYVDDKLSDKADRTEVLFKTSQSLTTTEKNQVKSNLDILKTWVGLEENKGADPNTIYCCIEE